MRVRWTELVVVVVLLEDSASGCSTTSGRSTASGCCLRVRWTELVVVVVLLEDSASDSASDSRFDRVRFLCPIAVPSPPAVADHRGSVVESTAHLLPLAPIIV
ncbi:hypothetical protein C487_08679 [Natrinema pallidum DSM 3751]|uniref:Uncharacterized protein n=1 Tax=Natrinema pallidum DSM 3751 TaxID=1227495 RepID=L9YXX5_9EURY|nr:hypothetical protein C487_08679 [Natrinema pallidum DSM 3751]